MFQDTYLSIAQKLQERLSWAVIARDLKVSPKTISKVRRFITQGVISFDKEGKAFYVKGAPRRIESEALGEDYRRELYHLQQLLGAETPKAGLKRACGMASKLMPYVLYHRVKEPAELISMLEGKVENLKNSLLAYQKEPAESMGRRLGLSEETLVYYRYVVDRRGWKGTLGGFLNSAVRDFFKNRGYRIVKETNIDGGEDTLRVIEPTEE